LKEDETKNEMVELALKQIDEDPEQKARDEES